MGTHLPDGLFLKMIAVYLVPCPPQQYTKVHLRGWISIVFCMNGDTTFEHFISRAKKTNVQKEGTKYEGVFVTYTQKEKMGSYRDTQALQ